MAEEQFYRRRRVEGYSRGNRGLPGSDRRHSTTRNEMSSAQHMLDPGPPMRRAEVRLGDAVWSEPSDLLDAAGYLS